MIGVLHLAAAASIVRETKIMEATEAARAEAGRLLKARRAALEAERESDLAAAYTGQPIPTMVRTAKNDAAIKAAEEKRRRKNARRLGIKLREIAGELESLGPVEFPRHLQETYGMRQVGMDIVVPVVTAQMLIEQGEAVRAAWREKAKGGKP